MKTGEQFLVPITSTNSKELEIRVCGSHNCPPGHQYGPTFWEHYLIHYIVKGRGSFITEKGNYDLHAGQGFFIEPSKTMHYKADDNDPWEYIWVGFYGTDAKRFLHAAGLYENSPTFEGGNYLEYFDGMIRNYEFKSPYCNAIFIKGELFRFFSDIALANQYVSTRKFSDGVTDYIRANISETLAISELAKYFGYSRTYFCGLFKSETGASPYTYITNLRMEMAAHLLTTGTQRINVISKSVGYTDPLLFSRVFKKHFGNSPRDFRERYAIYNRAKQND